MEFRALTQTEEHCFEKAVRRWGVAPRRAPDYVIEEQIQVLEEHREQVLRIAERTARDNRGKNTKSNNDGLKGKIMGGLRAARDRLKNFFARLNSSSHENQGSVPGKTWSASPGDLGGVGTGAFRPQFVPRV